MCVTVKAVKFKTYYRLFIAPIPWQERHNLYGAH